MYVELCVYAIPTPCLNAFLHFHPFIFFNFLEFFFCDFVIKAGEWSLGTRVYHALSLIPRPTCAFHCSAAVGLVLFLTRVMRRVNWW